jgi:hypothetical protein
MMLVMMIMMTIMMMMIITITDRTPHNNRPNILVVILNKTVKEVYVIDVAIPNSHNLHSTITERFHKYKDLK